MVVPRRQSVSVFILTGGGIAYGMLCLPAIQQRGYPPIDPFWWAVTFLWVIPLLLSCWFDSWRFPGRKRHLWIYCLATAFVNSATPVTIVPKFLDLTFVVFSTVLFFGPAHAAVGFGLEAIVQRILGRWRTIAEAPPATSERGGFQFSLLAFFYFQTVLSLAIGFPIAFRAYDESWRRKAAIRRAEEDWKRGEPAIYRDEDPLRFQGVWIHYEIDPHTGLRNRHTFPTKIYTEAYNRRTLELLTDDPDRLAAKRSTIPTQSALTALLTASDLDEVTDFPFRLTRHVTLHRSADGSLLMLTGNSTSQFGQYTGRIYVRTPAERNQVAVVRHANNWVAIVGPDGEILASATH